MAMICRLQPSSYLTFSTEVWQSCNAWVWILSFLWDMFMLRDVQYQKNSLVQLQQFLFPDPMILNFCLFAQPRRLKAVPPPYNLAPLGTQNRKKVLSFCAWMFFQGKSKEKNSHKGKFSSIFCDNLTKQLDSLWMMEVWQLASVQPQACLFVELYK